MDNAALSHDQLKNAIELIGIKVAPLVRAEIDNSKFFFLVRNDFNHQNSLGIRLSLIS